MKFKTIQHLKFLYFSVPKPFNDINKTFFLVKNILFVTSLPRGGDKVHNFCSSVILLLFLFFISLFLTTSITLYSTLFLSFVMSVVSIKLNLKKLYCPNVTSIFWIILNFYMLILFCFIFLHPN